jgi:hypothetical protein
MCRGPWRRWGEGKKESQRKREREPERRERERERERGSTVNKEEEVSGKRGWGTHSRLLEPLS